MQVIHLRNINDCRYEAPLRTRYFVGSLPLIADNVISSGRISLLVRAIARNLSPRNRWLPDHYRKGKAMLSGIVEPEFQQPRLVSLPGALCARTPASTAASGPDAPDAAATTVVTHATIHPTVYGVLKAGRRDWANSIAMH